MCARVHVPVCAHMYIHLHIYIDVCDCLYFHICIDFYDGISCKLAVFYLLTLLVFLLIHALMLVIYLLIRSNFI